MPEYTPNYSIPYPVPGDRIKDSNVAAKLADDIKATALTADAAITQEGQRAQTAAQTAAKTYADENLWPIEPTVITSVADIYALNSGPYRPISPQAAEGMGLPTRSYGILEIRVIAQYGKVMIWWPVSSSDSGFFVNRRLGSSNWTGWEEYTPASAQPAQDGAVEREMRVAQAAARRGGTYGTNGKAVLSLVFDHGTNNFLSKIVPMLAQYNVPATLGLNSRMYDPSYTFHHSDDETSWEQIQDAAIEHGITIWNHGMWHNASGPEEIIGGRDELQDTLPEIPIDGWLHTGQYGDFNHGNTFASYWQHNIGAVIMNAHAYLTGDIQEPVKPLTGQLKPGFDGQWVDSGANAISTIKSMVEDAQKVAGGVMLRHHPMYLDETGYLTSQQLEDFIAWAAAERDAGRLLILTADLINHADAGRSYRRNLLPGDGGSGNQARSINLSRNALAKGSVNELHAIINVSQAGTVNLIAQCQGLDRTQQTTVPAGRSEVRMFFTIPLTSTGDLTVTVGQSTHIGLEVEEFNVYPG